MRVGQLVRVVLDCDIQGKTGRITAVKLTKSGHLESYRVGIPDEDCGTPYTLFGFSDSIKVLNEQMYFQFPKKGISNGKSKIRAKAK
jgi:hypothetical protein